MATTVAIKRCKGCIFWQLYRGEVTNEAMVKMMNIQAPRRSRHACTLRLREVKDADGEKVFKPSLDPRDKKASTYGERTTPNTFCDHHTAKHGPYVTPPPETVELAQQPVATDIEAPAMGGFEERPGTQELATVVVSP